MTGRHAPPNTVATVIELVYARGAMNRCVCVDGFRRLSVLLLVVMASSWLVPRARATPGDAKTDAKTETKAEATSPKPAASEKAGDPAGAVQAPKGATAPTAQSAPPQPEAAPSEQAPPEAPVEAMSAALAGEQQRSSLQRKLEHVQSEREHTSTLVPWIVTGIGIAALVTGLVAGVGSALSCKGSCSTAFWPGWLVVGGTTAGAVGVVWLEHKRHDIAELELRRKQLEQELERVRWDTPLNASEPREHAAAVSFSG
jgi:hypothetical protein